MSLLEVIMRLLNVKVFNFQINLVLISSHL